MLGSAVYQGLIESGIDVTGTTRQGDVLEGRETLKFDVNFEPIEFLSKNVPKYKYVVNCIGLIPHKFEQDINLDLSEAIMLNSIFPNLLVAAAAISETKVIQIATDCVFSGRTGEYSEDTKPDPSDIYGITKSCGEVKHDNVMNLRCSVIGIEKKSAYSLLSWFLTLPKNASVDGFLNHRWNGVTSFAFAKVVKQMILDNTFYSGTHHLIPQDSKTKFELLNLFSKYGGREDILVRPMKTDMDIDRTLSTVNQERNKRLWQRVGYESPPSIEDMISELFEGTKREVL